MGTKKRKFNKAPRTRPRKTARDRRRRQSVQRKRLIALGMPEERVEKLNALEVRQLLKRPAVVAKLL